MTPSLALGQVVHEVVESLSTLPISDRLKQPLSARFEIAWNLLPSRVKSDDIKDRGLAMLSRIEANPGIVLQKAVKIRQDLPYYWLSEDDNIILCGKIDWLSYNEADDSVSIVDFKTGKFDEDPESLQLPIYLLLAQNCQPRRVAGAYYWYLDRDNVPKEVSLPNPQEALEKLLPLAKKVALARKLQHFPCPQKDGCRACLGLEKIYRGEAELVGSNSFGQDVFMV